MGFGFSKNGICLIVILLFVSINLIFLILYHYKNVLPYDETKNVILVKSNSIPNKELVERTNEIENMQSNNMENWFTKVISNYSIYRSKESAVTKNNSGISLQLLRQAKSNANEKPTIKILNIVDKKNYADRLNINKLHAVTYASHGGRDDRFCRAVESAIQSGIKLVILGWGVKWLGLSQKLEAAHSYARSISKTDVMLFTDAFDVMFTNAPEHILSEFENLNSDIIFSAECGCWPHVMEDRDACFNKYPKSPTPYRYLNSGTWIGKAGAAADMLEVVIKEAGNDFQNANDQKLIADMYINHKFNIKLDYYCKLFQSMHMTLDPPLPYCNPQEHIIQTGDGKWKNKLTNSYPAIFHFNGGGKTHHLSMEGKMWYKHSEHKTKFNIDKIADHLLDVPTQPKGKMKFSDICSSYVKNMQ